MLDADPIQHPIGLGSPAIVTHSELSQGTHPWALHQEGVTFVARKCGWRGLYVQRLALACKDRTQAQDRAQALSSHELPGFKL